MLAVILNAVVRRIRSAGAALEQNPGERDTVATYLGTQHSMQKKQGVQGLRLRSSRKCKEVPGVVAE